MSGVGLCFLLLGNGWNNKCDGGEREEGGGRREEGGVGGAATWRAAAQPEPQPTLLTNRINLAQGSGY